MIVRCETCQRAYDDASCWTLCPHGPLEFGLSDFCPRCDTISSLHGPCRHQLVAMSPVPLILESPEEVAMIGHARNVIPVDVGRVEPEHVDHFEERGPNQVRIHLWGWLGWLATLIIGRMHRSHPLGIRLARTLGAGEPPAGFTKRPADEPTVDFRRD